MEKRHDGKERIMRFTVARVVEHILVMTLVCVLLVTGLSQKFWHLSLSQWVIMKLGGIDSVRFVHRVAGVLLTLELLVHVAWNIVGICFLGWHPSMFITRKDVADALHDLKYYLGIEVRPAACDRYTYRQKFEYWAILLGCLVMVATGFILWFPALAARTFPGEFIPAAKLLHSNEALLIFVIVATWHVYSSIFSPEVFPLDTSIFTGYISRERMEREHPLELARIDEECWERMIPDKGLRGDVKGGKGERELGKVH